MSRRALTVALLLLTLAWPAAARAADFYVAPNGKDAWSGKLAAPRPDGSDGPFATIARARDEIRKLKAAGPLKGPVVVQVRGGTYPIGEPIVFTAQDSGTKDAPITYAAAPGETPVVSGGAAITGWKKQGSGPLWTTGVPEVKEGKWYFQQLFVGGKRAIPARSPNEGEVYTMAGPLQPLKDRNAAHRDPKTRLGFRFEDEQLKAWPDLDDAVVVAYHAWTTSRHLIESVDPAKHEVRFRNPSVWPFGWWGKERFYVENLREALDAPGEFTLDRKTGVLTYYPRPGEDMAKVEVIAPRAEVLLKLDGDAAAGKTVNHLRFEGLSFQHTSWTMPRAGAVDGQAAAFLKAAAVFAQGARSCTLSGCEIAHTGGYALWFARGSKDCRAERCHLHDLGAGGVRLGEMGLPAKPEEQAERNEVVNCFIHSGGRVFHAGIGAWIGRSSYNKLLHNEICDFCYSGVSVGWSWGYAPTGAHDNLVEYNHIHHLGWSELSDMGGIYCLGISPGTRLCYNRIHDVCSFSYGGWGLYTDEGSTHILMENNVVFRVKDGAFHQHYGRENTVRNNVLALSADLGQIRRSRQEEHSSFTVEQNILYSRGVPMLGGAWSNGQYALRKNCYWDASGKPPVFPGNLTLAQWQAKGHDEGSIVADPKFVDPDHGNFQLKPDSPALKLGFKPIDESQIGLTGPDAWRKLPEKYPLAKMKLPGDE